MQNRYSITNGIVSMTVERKSTNEMFTVTFNEEDLEKVAEYDLWMVQKSHDSVYAVKSGTSNILLHRLIRDEASNKKVFAKDNIYFNCTRNNLYVKK
ncbi:hypothetical protein BKP45_04905 [Anaerobacillus alkalidiazotrophicus]|uniref:Uncharacterized protein n=1 Tax=Anaerobacillus alkalidiazotrophicus TaxID=472963 RepID=A0A1S2MBG6_9BACI|nr:hypothetical protein [Anaerobacillus alkalidiazotrophicus]OIJ22019.1 hypothetical protein BKP45_04905 [Anaerobacillus alkalidiazotrophicus]